MNELEKEYYDYLIQLVCSRSMARRYSMVLNKLYNTEFVPILPLDENRESHIYDFRYRFGDEYGYHPSQIACELDIRPGSILELMVELSVRIEENIMQDDYYGDRTGLWFWDMMRSLGLFDMTDYIYDENIVDDILDRFINRKYEPNGRGGLFTVRRPYSDMRDLYIWAQAQWYIDEITP